MAFLWWRHFWMVPNLYMWIRVSVFMCVGEWVHTYIWTYISVFSFDLSILMFFFSFTLFSYFRFYLREHNENKAFLPVLCYPSHCWCYLYLSAVIFQLQVLYLDFWPVRFFCFCFCFCFVFLLRLIFRPNKFVIFQALYGFLRLVFMVKQNLLN